jgi:hypothetical protein
MIAFFVGRIFNPSYLPTETCGGLKYLSSAEYYIVRVERTNRDGISGVGHLRVRVESSGLR